MSKHNDKGLRFVERVFCVALAVGVVCYMALLMWGWLIKERML